MLPCYFKIFAIIVFQWALEANGLDSCGSNSSDSRSLGITVNSKKSDLGKWTDTLYAKAEHSDTLSDISVDVKHNVSQCSGRRIIQIQGLIQNGNYRSDEHKTVNEFQSIVFHSKHGSNVVVSSNRRTIEKNDLGADNNGAAFTNRALNNNELFEVRLDKKGGRTSYSFGIGILTENPYDVEVLPHMHFSEFAWMYHNDAIYNRNSQKRSSYGLDLNKLPVGTRFGVMKKPSGDIHFFVNDADQGSAVSGISDPVYGIVELWHNAEKVTILKP